MTDEELKQLIKECYDEEMKEIEEILAAIDADPELRNAQCPESVHDKLFEQIREYEEQKRLENLSEEDREWIRLGKIYRKRRKWNRYVVLIAALVAVLALGTVSMGEDKNILNILKQMISDEEQTVSDSGSTEPTQYIEEEDVFEKIENTYAITPVKLRYLPEKTVFQEAIFCSDIQEINLYYGTANKASIIYTIRPNYRESSFATIIEDKKVQEYTRLFDNVEIGFTEYCIEENGESRWIITWMHQDVQYQINVTGVQQEEIEKIANTLEFF